MRLNLRDDEGVLGARSAARKGQSFFEPKTRDSVT